jgi:hypothetical protein
VCAFVFVAGTIAPLDAARADERRCELDPDTKLLICSLVASPAPPASVQLSPALPLVWRRIPMNVDELIARDVGCVRTVAAIREVGVGYVITLTNEASGELLYLEYVCQWPGNPAPEPPPPPPTLAEFREANARVLTLRPALNPKPDIGGLTGLDTWLWCTDPGPVAAGVSLRGWTASGDVHVVQLAWDVDGMTGTAGTSRSCGSEAAPSLTWTPEAIDRYTIALTATWAGSWDLTWNGIPMGTFPLGPASFTSPAQAYPVDEYRGELTG